VAINNRRQLFRGLAGNWLNSAKMNVTYWIIKRYY